MVNFLVKIIAQNFCEKFDAFSRRNGSFIFLQMEPLRSESVKLSIRKLLVDWLELRGVFYLYKKNFICSYYKTTPYEVTRKLPVLAYKKNLFLLICIQSHLFAIQKFLSKFKNYLMKVNISLMSLFYLPLKFFQFYFGFIIRCHGNARYLLI